MRKGLRFGALGAACAGALALAPVAFADDTGGVTVSAGGHTLVVIGGAGVATGQPDFQNGIGPGGGVEVDLDDSKVLGIGGFGGGVRFVPGNIINAGDSGFLVSVPAQGFGSDANGYLILNVHCTQGGQEVDVAGVPVSFASADGLGPCTQP